MAQCDIFPLTAEVAAETGIHLGDGSLFIRRGGPHGTYRYDITGNSTEDQLYLIGQAIPIVSSAYGLSQPGIYVDRGLSWISLRYHSKAVVLFKHENLGLPVGRKTNARIPPHISNDRRLMRHLARELLATDGVLGFYDTARSHVHKYARIQLKLSSPRVIKGLANFLRDELGLAVSCRTYAVTCDGWARHPRHILQLNRAEDIETWRREIGFSNPSHISRFMVFERLGECLPKTEIRDRLSFLSGCSSKLSSSGPMVTSALIDVIDSMRKRFGFPSLDGETIIKEIRMIDVTLRSRLNRGLPEIVK